VKRGPDDSFPADLVTADEAIEIVVDALMLGSKPLRAMTKKVLEAQRRLRKVVDDEGGRLSRVRRGCEPEGGGGDGPGPAGEVGARPRVSFETVT
jgi:hypothetical protein